MPLEKPPKDYGDIPWLSRDEYEKAVGQARHQFSLLLGIFDKYGYGPLIPEVVNQSVRICEDFGLRVRGVDHPIEVEITRKGRELG